MTRKALSRRTGIPADTIKDIETGRFRLTAEKAMIISLATGVDGESLLKAEEPLLDLLGEPVSSHSSKQPDQLFWSTAELDSIKLLVAVALEAAQERRRMVHLNFLLQRWLAKTAKSLSLLPSIREKLGAVIGSLYPGLKLPESFYPDSKQEKLRWEMILQYRSEKFKEEIARTREDLLAERAPQKLNRLRELRATIARGEELSSKDKSEMDTLEDELILQGARSREELVTIQNAIEADTLRCLDAKQQDFLKFIREKHVTAGKGSKSKPAKKV
jgi:hypothetical protein